MIFIGVLSDPCRSMLSCNFALHPVSKAVSKQPSNRGKILYFYPIPLYYSIQYIVYYGIVVIFIFLGETIFFFYRIIVL